LAGQEQMVAKMKAEMETNQKQMTERLEAKITRSLGSFEVLSSPG
jgi:hypothetical protein